MTQSWPRHSVGSAFVVFKKAHQYQVFECFALRWANVTLRTIRAVGRGRGHVQNVCMRLSPCFVRLDHTRHCAPTWHTSSMIATTSSSVKA